MTLVVVVAPRYLLSWDAPSTPTADRAKAINDIRTTLLQGLAGIALLVGAFFTWRQLQVSGQGQITQRFTAAVEQLGSPSPEVREQRRNLVQLVVREVRVGPATVRGSRKFDEARFEIFWRWK
ncbi:hypothetical protein [Streptomyces thermospinosisporus]|uniref:hypothetical protein n=1 Tax=Streptomyces thermospinosisporus TaxID=161482 RepID=UPI0031D4DA84